MAASSQDLFRVTLLGTGAPPPVLNRFGPSTLVEAGDEKFIIDAGRGAMQRLHQLQMPFADPNHVRKGQDPDNEDDLVRFRTTYYFRTFDACRAEADLAADPDPSLGGRIETGGIAWDFCI